MCAIDASHCTLAQPCALFPHQNKLQNLKCTQLFPHHNSYKSMGNAGSEEQAAAMQEAGHGAPTAPKNTKITSSDPLFIHYMDDSTDYATGQKYSRTHFARPFSDGFLTSEAGKKVDRREDVSEKCESVYPNNCVGLLQCEHYEKDGLWASQGTAFLITDQLAVTAAHLVVNVDPYTREVVRMRPERLFLGLKGKAPTEKSGEITMRHNTIKSVEVHPEFLKLERERASLLKGIKSEEDKAAARQRIIKIYEEGQKCDFALIQLDDPVPHERFLQLGVCDKLVGKEVLVVGREVRRMSETEREVFHKVHAGTVKQETQDSLLFDLDFAPSQTGSPILYNDEGEWRVCAIAKAYHKSQSTLNMGARITHAVMNLVEECAQAMYAPYTPNRDPYIEKQLDQATRDKLDKTLAENKERIEKKYRGQIQQLQAELEVQQKEMQANATQIVKLEEKMAVVDKELEEVQEKLKQQTALTQKAQKELSEAQKSVDDKEKTIKELEEEQARLKEEIKTKEAEQAKLEKEIKEAEAEVKKLEGK